MCKKEAILFLPYAYGFNTRAKTILHKISFLLYIIAPCFINIMFMKSFEVNFVLFVLAFTGMYLVYEVGYIYNDIYTTQKEKNPTHWLKTEEMEYYAKDKFPLLISFRVVYLTAVCLAMSMIGSNNITLYIVGLTFLYLSFSLHNYFRGPINIVTDGFLNLFKYLTPMVIFSEINTDILFYVYLFFEVPFARMIGYVIGKKYALHRLANINVDIRRVIYYLILTFVAGILFVVDHIHIWFLYGAVYMLVYRVLCLILSRRENINKVRWKNEDRNGNC